jgi:hypothetical protein
MRVEIRGIEEVQNLLRNLSEKEAQYATFVGTNRVAYAVMQEQREEVKTTFDGPTRFIQTGIRYEKMTKTRRQARAYWTEERDPYIRPHVFGGARAVKKIENVYRGRGILPPGRWMVPGSNVPLDKFGNPTKTFNKRIYDAASHLATPGATYNNLFIGGRYPRKNLVAGIWERRGFNIELVYKFTREPQYQKRYDFYGTATATAKQVAPGIMAESVARAVARSRR